MRIRLNTEEISVIYGLLSSVNVLKSDEFDITSLRDRFEKFVDENYPGYDAIPHFGDGYDCIEIYKD